jgi:DNA-binding response OmpR family regulator
MANFGNLQVLVIANAPRLRGQLHSLLGEIGFGKVRSVAAAATAVRRLRQQHYDLVLCDHALGDGQNGQHLLEDLRQHEIIPRDTLFVMITAERTHGQVISTAELQPDDYILTPFTPGSLKNRLARIIRKREAFLPAWQSMAAGDWLGAIDYCARAAKTHPRYLFDFFRLKAEIQYTIGRLNEAEATYREILAGTRLPSAKLGLARTLALRKNHAESEALLTELIAENELFMAAYDLLAQVRADCGRREAACDVLKTAAGRSPYRIGRQRQLGELALSVGDAVTAETVLTEVVRQSAKSGFRDPEDHVRLIQAQLAQNKLDAAKATVDELEGTLGAQPKTELCKALASAMLNAHMGHAEQARAKFAAVVELSAGQTSLSVGLAQELVKNCIHHQLDNIGGEMVLNILRVAGDERTVESTRELLRAHGLETVSRQIETRLQEEVRQLIASGAKLAHARDYDGMVAAMMDAARKMPGHPVVIFNAALALLRHIEHRGWNQDFARQARELIERVGELAPTNDRVAELAEFMHLLIERDRLHARGKRRAARG